MNLEEVKAKWSRCLDKMQDIADEASEAGELISDNVKRLWRYEKVEKESEKLRHEFSRLEKLEAETTKRNRPQSRAVSFPSDDFDLIRNGTLNDVPTYRSLFHKDGTIPGDVGFRSITRMFAAISSRRYDPRLEQLRAAGMSGLTDTDGGFLLSPAMASGVLDFLVEQSLVLKRADVKAMDHRSLLVNAWDGSDRSASVNGLIAHWSNEGEQMSIQVPKLRQLELNSKKLVALVGITQELLSDTRNTDEELSRLIAKTLAFYLDKAFLLGSGAGRPLGVINSPSLITISKEGSQTADTINYQNLKKMASRLLPESDKSAIWIASPSTKPELLELVVAHTNSDTMIPVLQEQNGEYRILGRPCIFSEHLPVLGDKGDIMLVDFNGYYVGMRKEIGVNVSEHVRFVYDEVLFKGTMRVDGQAKLDTAITPSNGGDTLSWAIALEERA